MANHDKQPVGSINRHHVIMFYSDYSAPWLAKLYYSNYYCIVRIPGALYIIPSHSYYSIYSIYIYVYILGWLWLLTVFRHSFLKFHGKKLDRMEVAMAPYAIEDPVTENASKYWLQWRNVKDFVAKCLAHSVFTVIRAGQVSQTRIYKHYI